MSLFNITTLEYTIAGTAIVATLWAIVNSFITDIIKFAIGYIKSRIMYSFTCDVNEGEGYSYVMEWLADNVIERFRNTIDTASGLTPKMIKAPGFGLHFLWHDKFFMILNHIKEHQPHDENANYVLTISTFWFWRKKLTDFYETISKISYSTEEDHTNIYYLNDHTWGHTFKHKRSMEHFYLKEETKKEICDDIETFLKNKEFYRNRSIPWNRGYFLYGVAGTGKTSMAFVLAGKYNLPIYYMNLNGIADDEHLNFLFMSIHNQNAVILIEDIDTFGVARDREMFDDDSGGSYGISLSGLLNSIDGILAKEGKIVIMTTNHPDHIDPALLRFGRIDKKFEIGLLCPEETARMFCVFFPEHSNIKDRVLVAAQKKQRPAAEWQGLYIQHQNNINGLFQALENEPKKLPRKKIIDKPIK